MEKRKLGDLLLDRTGEPVPADLAATFQGRDVFQALMREVTRIAKELEAIAENTDAGAFFDWLGTKAALNLIHESLKYAQPYAVCPECSGRNPRCRECNGVGWMTETMRKLWGNNHREGNTPSVSRPNDFPTAPDNVF